MITTLSRYLTLEYLKVFLFSLLAFLTLLIVSRLEEIASYATLGSKKSDIIIFTLCQITAILPLAIPLSTLISSFLLFQRLSESHELTVLRASGFSFFSLCKPLMTAAAFLALGNLTLTSELATRAHLSTRKMLYEITTKNPLVLLQNASIASLKGGYVQFSPQRNGKEAKNLLVAWKEPSNDRLNLLLAKKLKLKNEELIGKNITLISSQENPEVGQENYLVVENQEEIVTHSLECASFIHQKRWKISSDHLNFSLLCIRMQKLKEEILQELQTENRLKIVKNLTKCHSDIVRRLSLGLAPLSFTLMGISFGIRIERRISKKKLLVASALAALTLTSFFVAKTLDHKLFFSSFFFIVPHLLVIFSSFALIKRYNEGRR